MLIGHVIKRKGEKDEIQVVGVKLFHLCHLKFDKACVESSVFVLF